jgi:glutathionylspermidine synthase
MNYSIDRQAQRQAFFETYHDRFSWYDLEAPRSDSATGDRVYACYDVLSITLELVTAIEKATVDCWQILVAAGSEVRSRSDSELIALGYLPETLDLLRDTVQPPFIGRCDFAVTDRGIFMLECNAEVATFLVETFEMNGLVATQFGQQDPNAQSKTILQQELNAYLDRIIPELLGKAPEDCRIAFSAIGNAAEDIGTAKYLCELCHYPAEVVPIEQFQLDETGVYNRAGQPIDVIYRIYPTEWMVLDRDPITQTSLWEILEPLIFDRKVALINPVSSMLLQNKSLLASITTLAQQGHWSAEEQKIIDRHFLLTTLDETAIAPPYVSKPTFGREGNEVRIVEDSILGNTELFNPSAEYASFQKVHQQYVQLPTIDLQDDTYTLQISCFVINGKATGIAARIGDRVITNHAYFLAIGL